MGIQEILDNKLNYGIVWGFFFGGVDVEQSLLN